MIKLFHALLAVLLAFLTASIYFGWGIVSFLAGTVFICLWTVSDQTSDDETGTAAVLAFCSSPSRRGTPGVGDNSSSQRLGASSLWPAMVGTDRKRSSLFSLMGWNATGQKTRAARQTQLTTTGATHLSSPGPHPRANRIQHTITNKTMQCAAGPLLSSQNFTFPRVKKDVQVLSMSPQLRPSINSNGFSFIASKYGTPNHPMVPSPGILPHVRLGSRERVPLKEANTNMLRSPVTVKIAPPDTGKIHSPKLTWLKKPEDFKRTPDTKDVLSALKEGSRKRTIITPVDEDDFLLDPLEANAKRRRKESNHSSVSSSSMPSLPEFLPDLSSNNLLYTNPSLRFGGSNTKRPASPPCEISDIRHSPMMKKPKKETKNNPILSSLSSSKRIWEKQSKQVKRKLPEEAINSAEINSKQPCFPDSGGMEKNSPTPGTSSMVLEREVFDEANTQVEGRRQDGEKSQQTLSTPVRESDIQPRRKYLSFASPSINLEKVSYANVYATKEDYENDRRAEELRVWRMLSNISEDDKKLQQENSNEELVEKAKKDVKSAQPGSFPELATAAATTSANSLGSLFTTTLASKTMTLSPPTIQPAALSVSAATTGSPFINQFTTSSSAATEVTAPPLSTAVTVTLASSTNVSVPLSSSDLPVLTSTVVTTAATTSKPSVFTTQAPSSSHANSPFKPIFGAVTSPTIDNADKDKTLSLASSSTPVATGGFWFNATPVQKTTQGQSLLSTTPSPHTLATNLKFDSTRVTPSSTNPICTTSVLSTVSSAVSQAATANMQNSSSYSSSKPGNSMLQLPVPSTQETLPFPFGQVSSKPTKVTPVTSSFGAQSPSSLVSSSTLPAPGFSFFQSKPETSSTSDSPMSTSPLISDPTAQKTAFEFPVVPTSIVSVTTGATFSTAGNTGFSYNGSAANLNTFPFGLSRSKPFVLTSQPTTTTIAATTTTTATATATLSQATTTTAMFGVTSTSSSIFGTAPSTGKKVSFSTKAVTSNSFKVGSINDKNTQAQQVTSMLFQTTPSFGAQTSGSTPVSSTGTTPTSQAKTSNYIFSSSTSNSSQPPPVSTINAAQLLNTKPVLSKKQPTFNFNLTNSTTKSSISNTGPAAFVFTGAPSSTTVASITTIGQPALSFSGFTSRQQKTQVAGSQPNQPTIFGSAVATAFAKQDPTQQSSVFGQPGQQISIFSSSPQQQAVPNTSIFAGSQSQHPFLQNSNFPSAQGSFAPSFGNKQQLFGNSSANQQTSLVFGQTSGPTFSATAANQKSLQTQGGTFGQLPTTEFGSSSANSSTGTFSFSQPASQQIMTKGFDFTSAVSAAPQFNFTGGQTPGFGFHSGAPMFGPMAFTLPAGIASPSAGSSSAMFNLGTGSTAPKQRAWKARRRGPKK